MSTKETQPGEPVAVAAAQPAGGTHMTSTAAAAAAANPPPPILPTLGRLPSNHTCQYCQHTGQTQVKEKLGNCAIIALVIFIICFLPLFWLPLVMPSCKDKQHVCANCQRIVSLTSKIACHLILLYEVFTHTTLILILCHLKVGENEADCDTCCKTETN